VIKLESKGSKFERIWLKPIPGEWSHKLLNVRTEPEVLSKRDNTDIHPSFHSPEGL
jgi:hypothetical protein